LAAWGQTPSLSFGKQLLEACRSSGILYLVDHGVPHALLEAVLVETASFFAQSEEDKLSIDIKKSSNHRGYGVLKNKRDWREQIHLGTEAPPSMEAAQYWQLWGANQWPRSPHDRFKLTMLSYFEAIDGLARLALSSLALALEKPAGFFTDRMKDRPYLLMKAMSYLPQENYNADAGGLQYGVTAHCDWSWLTFLLQDQVGGLEARDKNGLWHAVEPIAGSIVVNTGELLEIETGGLCSASPHRVINARIDRQRYSVPIFVNPALDAAICPAGNSPSCQSESRQFSGAEHVHKVIKPGDSVKPFIFGQSEYQRKAQGQWCYKSECLEAV
jgi:isopenicillin N synthase-like dioxygenase